MFLYVPETVGTGSAAFGEFEAFLYISFHGIPHLYASWTSALRSEIIYKDCHHHGQSTQPGDNDDAWSLSGLFQNPMQPKGKLQQHAQAVSQCTLSKSDLASKQERRRKRL